MNEAKMLRQILGGHHDYRRGGSNYIGTGTFTKCIWRETAMPIYYIEKLFFSSFARRGPLMEAENRFAGDEVLLQSTLSLANRTRIKA